MWQFTSETHFTKFLLACLNCTTVWNVLDTESTISKLVTFQLLLQTVISNNPHHLIGNRPYPYPITSVFIPKIQNHIIRPLHFYFSPFPQLTVRGRGFGDGIVQVTLSRRTMVNIHASVVLALILSEIILSSTRACIKCRLGPTRAQYQDVADLKDRFGFVSCILCQQPN